MFAEAKRLYNTGRRVQDIRRGFGLLKQAAALGHVAAHEWLGFVYRWFGTPGQRRLSFKHYKIAAEAGPSTSQANAEYQVGRAYDEGIGVRRDRRQALLWIRKAAKHDSAHALSWLGWNLLAGGAAKDRKRGFEMVLAAASRGEPFAQYAVGVCYEKGEGVRVDTRAAFRWYLRAAKRGYAPAADELSRVYGTGAGVRMNKAKAAFWRRG
jgi:TPR repeat protein